MRGYETHITIEPVLDETKLAAIREAVRPLGFRVADLLMAKRAEDTPERSRFDTFLTGHTTDYMHACRNCREVVSVVQGMGYKVWRYKIEEIILDSRVIDLWGILK